MIQANLLVKCPDYPEAKAILGAGIQAEDEVNARLYRECQLRQNTLVDTVNEPTR